jgi:hypothetical protein
VYDPGCPYTIYSGWGQTLYAGNVPIGGILKFLRMNLPALKLAREREQRVLDPAANQQFQIQNPKTEKPVKELLAFLPAGKTWGPFPPSSFHLPLCGV